MLSALGRHCLLIRCFVPAFTLVPLGRPSGTSRMLSAGETWPSLRRTPYQSCGPGWPTGYPQPAAIICSFPRGGSGSFDEWRSSIPTIRSSIARSWRVSWRWSIKHERLAIEQLMQSELGSLGLSLNAEKARYFTRIDALCHTSDFRLEGLRFLLKHDPACGLAQTKELLEETLDGEAPKVHRVAFCLRVLEAKRDPFGADFPIRNVDTLQLAPAQWVGTCPCSARAGGADQPSGS